MLLGFKVKLLVREDQCFSMAAFKPIFNETY